MNNIYLTVSESDPHCEEGGVGGRHGLLSKDASVEFCTAAVTKGDVEDGGDGHDDNVCI